MSSAVVINLDYENHGEQVCQEIWDAVREHMLAAGFHLDNRVFILNRDHAEVCELARRVIDDIESHLDFTEKHLFRYFKDFYAYDMAHTDNLMLPARTGIEVKG